MHPVFIYNPSTRRNRLVTRALRGFWKNNFTWDLKKTFSKRWRTFETSLFYFIPIGLDAPYLLIFKLLFFQQSFQVIHVIVLKIFYAATGSLQAFLNSKARSFIPVTRLTHQNALSSNSADDPRCFTTNILIKIT